MADLPDLDTTSIGFCAYWNAIDQGGVGTIDPEEVLSDRRINNYTLYDNGWEAESYTSITGREIKMRAKSDGWFVAYMDRSENYATRVNHPDSVRGPWDISNDWTDRNNSSYVSNALSEAIRSAASYLSNWNSITFNHSDVGLYNFEYSTATGITGMSSATNTDYDGSDSNTCGVLYTEGTTVNWATAFGQSYGSDANVNFEGSTIVGDGEEYGALDLIAAGLIPNAATEYQMYVQANSYESNLDDSNGNVLFIWE